MFSNDFVSFEQLNQNVNVSLALLVKDALKLLVHKKKSNVLKYSRISSPQSGLGP